MKLITLLPLLLLLNSCLFKTAEQIRREKLIDSLALQMTEIQKKSADMNIKIGDLQKEVSLFNGLIEEKGHKTNQTYLRGFRELRAEIDLLKEDNKNKQDELESQKKKLVDQQAYLDRVLATLDKIAAAPTNKSSNGKKLSSYDQAMADYKAKRYSTAKKQLLKLVESKKIKGKKKARIIHNLGMISYIKGNYNDSLIYFSRLFTEYPKSGYNKNGLFHLGHSFRKLKKKVEANQAFSQLISTYPKSWQAKQAKKQLKKK